MADDLVNLNERLDFVLLEFFEKLENLEDVRNALTNSMRDGFLSMSKARYSMGNKSVGELQYARNMMASTLVIERDVQLSKDEEDVVKTDLRSLEVVFDRDKATNEKEKKESVLENERSGLRQRVNIKDQREDLKDRNMEERYMDERKASNPLKWFGVLVPTSLRECQKDFKTACRLSWEVVQLERDLDRIITDYATLKEEKRMLQSCSLDINE